MKPYDHLQERIQATLEKIAHVNISLARHEAQDIPDVLAIEQFASFKRQLTQDLLSLLADMDIRLQEAA